MKEVKLIKRYQNRKLYDTSTSRYVTLEDITNVIRDGKDVKVVDNKTNVEITSVILSQIIFEEEKKRRPLLPIQTLKRIIQFGEESLHEFYERYIAAPGAQFQSLKEDIDKHIQRLVKKGELSAEDGKRFLRDLFVITPQRGLDELQRRIDENVVNALRRLNIPSKREIDSLKKKVDTLVKRIKDWELRAKKK